MSQRRLRPQVMLTLSPEAIAILDRLAAEAGSTRSAMVELLIRSEAARARRRTA